MNKNDLKYEGEKIEKLFKNILVKDSISSTSSKYFSFKNPASFTIALVWIA